MRIFKDLMIHQLITNGHRDPKHYQKLKNKRKTKEILHTEAGTNAGKKQIMTNTNSNVIYIPFG
jgi:hypothetical protein